MPRWLGVILDNGYRISLRQRMPCQQGGHVQSADAPLNRRGRLRVKLLFDLPESVERCRGIDRDRELAARLDKPGGAFDRPPHVAGVMQHAPGIDDVESAERRATRRKRKRSSPSSSPGACRVSVSCVVATEFSSISIAVTDEAPSDSAASECRPDPLPMSRKALPARPSGKSFFMPATAASMRFRSMVLE